MGTQRDFGTHRVKGVPVATSFFGQGNSYFVDGTSGVGSSGNTGRNMRRPMNNLTNGEAKMEANQNDILYYLCSNTSQTIAATIAWDKNYSHLHGVAAPVHAAQRARVFNSGNSGNSPLMTISATGCSFKNLYFFQGSTAADTRCIDVTGNRNYFENVHFAGMGHTTAGADVPACSLKVTSRENLFVNCTIGLDTVLRAAANAELLFDGGTTAATRNMFYRCRFISYSETSTKLLVKVNDTAAMDRFTLFEDCLFYNFSENHAATLAAAFSVPASASTHDIILRNCMAVGIDEWEANDRGQIWSDMTVATAEDGGVAVEPINNA